jgi:putative glycosyltransferase (TIGR04372 family)
MSGIDARALLKVRERITSFRSRPWSERLLLTRQTGLELLVLVAGSVIRGLFVVIYAPAIIVALLLNLRFPHSHAISTNFGHLASDPHWYAIAQEIGLRPKRRAILVVSRNQVVNRYLLEMWQSKFTVVSHPVLAMLLTPLKWLSITGPPMYMLRYEVTKPNGEPLKYGPALDEISRQFEKKNNGKPLFTLGEEIHTRGKVGLKQLGIPPGAWWVALHVREASYHGTNGSPRNSDPLSYVDAAQAIIDRGGYVVRIGNKGMTPILQTEGFIDYANSNVKSDWLDIYLIGGARFLLGSVSGPNEIARLFGVPVASVNMVPMCQGPLGRNDLRIPKLMTSGSSANLLSFDEILSSPELRDLHTRYQFKQAQVALQDNLPEDIRELSEEMMDRIDGTRRYDAIDDELQERFKELIHSHDTPQTFGTVSRIGSSFLSKHSHLLLSKN